VIGQVPKGTRNLPTTRGQAGYKLSRQPLGISEGVPMKQRTIIIIGVGALALFVISIVVFILFFRSVFTNQFAQSMNGRFGDHYFKTVLSLVELHRIRTGSYPEDLNQLEYPSDWDGLAIQSVEYFTNDKRNAYCIRVLDGWSGPPADLAYPPEFFKGTGFDPGLCK
jgi:hypothetical protein